MSRRFVIGADGLDAEKEQKLREFVASKGAWWHWIGNLWLLNTADKELTAVQIRDFIRDLGGNLKVLVFEFPEDITWAASGQPNKEGKHLWDWLSESWSRSG